MSSTSPPPHAASPRATAVVSDRGAARWVRGHPWIFRSDVRQAPDEAGIVAVHDTRGRFVGQALNSPASSIRLRLIEETDRSIDPAWWRERIGAAARRRKNIDATAWRVVHGEADGLPSLVVDRYDRWVVVQLLSAGLERHREDVLAAITDVLRPEGILLRNDPAVRSREGLPREVSLAAGSVPGDIEVREGAVRYLAAPWTGQKTGAFLDQRPARLRAGVLAPEGGRALDCFSYHGSFAIHLAGRAGEVVALDASAEALERGRRNAGLNGFGNIRWEAADAFEWLRAREREGAAFDMIVLDPPAFAKSRSAVGQALRGYGEINLRAMRLLSPDGILLTASCSHHVDREKFFGMLAQAAADSGRRLRLEELLVQGIDHPEVLTIPETSYLKGAIVRAV